MKNNSKNSKNLKEYHWLTMGKFSPFNILVICYRFQNLISSKSKDAARHLIRRENQLANFFHDTIDFIKQKYKD